MKKISLAKVLSLVFVCVMLLGALTISVFAAEDKNVEIVAADLYHGGTYQFMFAVNAPDGVEVSAVDSKGNSIEVAYVGAETVFEKNCKIYVLAQGVAAQAIDEVITFTAEYNGEKAVLNYSVLQYIYERTNQIKNNPNATDEQLAQVAMYEAFVDYAVLADKVFNGVTENSFDKYQYVVASGVAVNGVNVKGMYAPGSTPFANIDAIEYDAEKYELAVTVNGAASTLDALKALVVADEKIEVVVEIVEKAHEHDYDENVTAPTCTAEGYTTYTCSCGHSYTGNTTDALGHKDENGDYKCDGTDCTELVLPADGEALTIAQALTIGKLFAKDKYTTQKYYLTGIITEVQNTTYGNIVISDGENSILIYGLYSYDGETRYDALTYKPQVYDEITVYGIIGFYNAAQMKNGWMDEVVAHECEYDEEVTDPTCTDKGFTTYTCDVCGDSYKDNETDANGHKFADGICLVCGIADTHVHQYTEEVTAPTCTAAGYTTFTCDECGYSYEEEGEAATGIHVDNNTDFVCDYDNCNEKIIPAADSVLTIEQAIALGKLYASNSYTSGKYYVTVTISEVYQTTYGNMKAKAADGTVFTVYGTYSADGSVRYDALSYKPVVGDTITVYGIIGSYNNAPQMKNGWITDIVHECDFSVAASCEKGVSCAICGAVQEGSEALGHSFSEATCTDAAKCATCGKVDGEAPGHNYVDGVCTVCGHEDGGAEIVYETERFDIAANKGALSDKTISWSSDNFNFLGEQASSSNAIRTSDSDHFRMYQGSKFTISGKDGQKIQSMVVKCTSSDYATALANSLTTAGVTAVADGTSVTFTADSAVDSIAFSLTKQSRVQYFIITYYVD